MLLSMVAAYKTQPSVVAAATADFCIDLSDFSDSWALTPTLVFDSRTVIDSVGVEVTPVSIATAIGVPALYYGDEPKRLRANRQDSGLYALLILDEPGSWVGGPAVVAGLPIDAPSDTVVVHNVDFIAGGQWYEATGSPTLDRAHAAALDDSYVANAAFASGLRADTGDQLWILATTSALANNLTIEARIGSNTAATLTIQTAGLYRATALTNIPTAGTDTLQVRATRTLTTAETVTLWILSGGQAQDVD